MALRPEANGCSAIETFADPEETAEAVAAWITARVEQGIEPDAISVFIRSNRELRRARIALKRCGIQAVGLSDRIDISPGKLALGAMHLAKGLEFRALAVMARDDEVIPSQERIENVGDDADLEDVCTSERHLLYAPLPAPATIFWSPASSRPANSSTI